MKLPVFHTARLVLRPAANHDIDALQGIWNHEEVRRYLFDDQVVSRALTQEVLELYRAEHARGHALWVVSLEDDPEVVGCVGLLETALVAEFDMSLKGMVEPVAAFAPMVWHNGYAHEALTQILAYAFHELGLESLAGVADVPNAASDAMPRRAGFVATGECDGPRHRMRTYRLTRGGFHDR